MKNFDSHDPTKDRILAAAGPIFAERGFQAATVREICQRAGVNLAAVNYHFGDKEGLYRAAVRTLHQRRSETFPLPDWTPGVPPETRLEDFIRTLLTRMLVSEADDEWHCQLMLREISHPTEASAELVRDYIRPHFELLNEILGELLPKDASAERRRLTAFSVIGQCLYYRVAGPIVAMLTPANASEAYSPERLARHIASFTLAAVGRAPRQTAKGART